MRLDLFTCKISSWIITINIIDIPSQVQRLTISRSKARLNVNVKDLISYKSLK